MSHRQYSDSKLIARIALGLLLLLSGMPARAQLGAAVHARMLHDSLLSPSAREFVYNSLTLTNTTAAPVALHISTELPSNWQLVTQLSSPLQLRAHETLVLPLRLVPGATAAASWQPVRIRFRNMQDGQESETSFAVRVQEHSRLKATLLQPNMILPAWQQRISSVVQLRNAGNTPINCTLSWSNDFFKAGGNRSIALAPGSDTILNIELDLNERLWSRLTKELLRIVVSTGTETMYLNQEIGRVGSMLKAHSTAYREMPLQLEAGSIYSGSAQGIMYYGGVFGRMDLGHGNRLGILLRSDTYTETGAMEDRRIRLDYEGRQLQLSLGNVMEVNQFISDGYGGKLGWRWKGGKAEAFTVLKSRTGNSKLAGAHISYFRGPVTVTHTAAAQLDLEKKTSAQLLTHTAELPLGAQGKVSITAGAGLDQSSLIAPKSLLGSTLGYNLQWQRKKWSVWSGITYNSNNYPGVFKGQRLQMHDVRRLFGNMFVGGYYEFNYRSQSFFQDSILLSDVFNVRTANMGLRTGRAGKKGSIMLSLGQQQQQQAGFESFVTNYRYLNLNTTLYFSRKSYLTLNSFAGYTSVASRPGLGQVFASSTQGNLQLGKAGLLFRYDRGPFYYHEMIHYAEKPVEVEHVILSPFVQVGTMGAAFSGRVQLNYVHAGGGQPDNTNAMLNLTWQHRAGFNMQLAGVIPVQGSNKTPYVSLTLRKQLQLPVPLARQYHQLKLVLFKDLNCNGVIDKGEERLAGSSVQINGILFVSNEAGEVIYKNVAAGNFRLDFSNNIRGWMPVGGMLQNLVLTASQTMAVPFCKSKVLSGRLVSILDSNSYGDFNPANIKVTATGANNTTFTTITNLDGTFFLNLPADHYTIQLNEAAFDERFRPREFAQQVNLIDNQEKEVVFEIFQKKRVLKIRRIPAESTDSE